MPAMQSVLPSDVVSISFVFLKKAGLASFCCQQFKLSFRLAETALWQTFYQNIFKCSNVVDKLADFLRLIGTIC